METAASDGVLEQKVNAAESRKSANKTADRRRLRRALLVLAVLSLATVCAWWWYLSTRPEPSPLRHIIAAADPEVALLLEEADKVVGDLLFLFPDSSEAWDLAAQLYGRFGNPEAAIECWNKAISLDPNFAAAYQSLAMLALEAGDNARAETYYRKAWALEPSSSVYPTLLAEVLIQQGKLEEAVNTLRLCLQRHPRSMSAHALLGQALVQLKEYDEAKDHLEITIRQDPGYTNAYYSLFTALSKLGYRREAEEAMRKFRELKARDEQRHRTELKTTEHFQDVADAVAVVYASAAKIRLSKGDVATTETYLARAVELDPDCSQALRLRAWLSHRQGKQDEAVTLLTEDAENNLDDASAQIEIGRLFREIGEYDRAEVAFRRAITLTPTEPGPYLALVSLLMEHGGDPLEMESLALKAAACEATPETLVVVARTAMGTGDRAAALSAVEAALRLDPDNAALRELLQRLSSASQ